MQDFDVINAAVDLLHREVWTFGVYVPYSEPIQIYLSRFARQSRPSRRHKWRTDAQWTTRAPRSQANYGAWRTIARADVPLPKGVAVRAWDRVAATMRVYVGHPNIEGEDGGKLWPGVPEV